MNVLAVTDQLNIYGTIAKTIFRNAFGIKVDPEISLLPQLIKPGSVCFDVGAAYGRYALPLSKLVGPRGHVFCFEPAEYNRQILSAIVKFYRLRNVTIVEQALSDQEGIGTLALPIKKNSNVRRALAYSLAHLATDHDSNHILNKVAMTTLDAYVSQMDLKKIDFIKCDVEGAELKVFQGGKTTISRHKPIVLCEAYKTWLERFDASGDQIYHFFSDLGYQAYSISRGQLAQVNDLNEEGNYFFIHLQS